MPDTDDKFLIPVEAIEYIDEIENKEKTNLAKVEVIEYFFKWLKQKPHSEQVEILKEVLSAE